MSNISYYEKLIQEKRKTTPFRDFVREIWSWSSVHYYKSSGNVSVFPDTDRIWWVVDIEEFSRLRDNLPCYEYTGNFFGDLASLQKITPLPCVRQYGTYSNSIYSDTNANVENCFLVRCSTWCKNIGYSFVVKKTSDVWNSVKIQNGEGNIYASYSVDNWSNIFYSRCIENSSNIWFSSNLTNCYECILSDNLENKSYVIKNIAYSQEDYLSKKKEILDLKSHFPYFCSRVTWTKYKNINSENIENIIGGTHILNGRNGIIVWSPIGTRNIYDALGTWTLWDYYACADSGVNSEYIYCSVAIVQSSRIFYSQFLENCSFCIGCIWLKNKSYCILNKQYSKEEWEVKVCEIFASMEADGTLGSFFPASMCPFYFNDTLAYLIDDTFTKEEVEAEWYLWRDEPIKVDIPEWLEIVNSSELDRFQGFREEKWHIDPSILKKGIVDERWNYYRIVKMEYDFLMKHGLPLPTTHWLDRIKMGFR